MFYPQSFKSEEESTESSDPGGSGLIAENGVFTSCGLKTDFHCCNPWWNIFQKPYEPYSFYENMYWFILGGIKSWLHHGESPLSSWGAVQGYRAHGFNSCSIKDSCFKACGISVLPPKIEPTLPELEGGLLIPGPPGTFQALFFPSTTAICSSPLYDLGNLLLCIRIIHNRRCRMGSVGLHRLLREPISDGDCIWDVVGFFCVCVCFF